MMKLRARRETVQRGGYGVQIALRHMRNDAKVFWSEQSNSYVVVDDGDQLTLLSINGIGEIRWRVLDTDRNAESNAAREYFFTN